LIELSELTLGIVGLGQIGLAVARIASALGMQVIGLTRSLRQLPAYITPVKDLETLLARSDVVSLHVPLTPQTERLINAKTISMMKPGAMLLNSSRGGLLDEGAVAEALNTGRLAGAGVDVLSTEPPRPDNPLLSARNCFVTPHQAWGTRAARQRLMDIAVANLRAFLDGKPQNVVKVA
jgi:glycerate dehydrogenase